MSEPKGARDSAKAKTKGKATASGSGVAGPGPILVVGGAHLDILSRAAGQRGVIDKTGSTTFEVGGTACNTAVDLAKLGARTRLLTALAVSPLSSIIEDHARAAGVELFEEKGENLPMGAFCAHLDEKGDIISAVSSTPVENHVFSDRILRLAMAGASTCIIDCNLRETEMRRVAKMAKGAGIPVFIAAVSESKAQRALCLAGTVDGLFINEHEAVRVAQKSMDNVSQDAAGGAIASVMGCPVAVTMGRFGARVYWPQGSYSRIDPPEVNEEKVNRLGSGDAFMAGAVFHMVVGNEHFATACQFAMDVAKQVVEMPTGHLGSLRPLESALSSLRTAAFTDHLTGLANRAATRKALMDAKENAGRNRKNAPRAAILMLDVDHFKSVNDTYGHDMGDVALKACSGVIAESMRSGDSAGRWGGEEFMAILPSAGSEDAAIIAERIRARIEAEVLVPRRITVSIGCSVWEFSDDDGMHEAIKRADLALYEAKSSGRNRVCVWSPEIEGQKQGATGNAKPV